MAMDDRATRFRTPSAAVPRAYASRMDFRVLGPVEVRDDGVGLAVGGSKQRSILALLVVNVGQPVSLDRIVDGSMGRTPPKVPDTPYRPSSLRSGAKSVMSSARNPGAMS